MPPSPAATHPQWHPARPKPTSQGKPTAASSPAQAIPNSLANKFIASLRRCRELGADPISAYQAWPSLGAVERQCVEQELYRHNHHWYFVSDLQTFAKSNLGKPLLLTYVQPGFDKDQPKYLARLRARGFYLLGRRTPAYIGDAVQIWFSPREGAVIYLDVSVPWPPPPAAPVDPLEESGLGKRYEKGIRDDTQYDTKDANAALAARFLDELEEANETISQLCNKDPLSKADETKATRLQSYLVNKRLGQLATLWGGNNPLPRDLFERYYYARERNKEVSKECCKVIDSQNYEWGPFSCPLNESDSSPMHDTQSSPDQNQEPTLNPVPRR